MNAATPPPPPPPPTGPTPRTAAPMSAKEAKAQAKAAKAYAKAQRPFWKKKRVILPAIVVLLIIVLVASNGGDDKDASTNSPTAGSEVSKGLGARDASGDVTVVRLADPDVLGFRTAEVKITNNSSKRSNYLVELSLESTDGRTQYDTAVATAQNVDPGQTTGGSVLPFT